MFCIKSVIKDFAKLTGKSPGPFLAVYCVRQSHINISSFSKYFQILYIFAQIFKCFFALFLPFFWKIMHMPLLSRIGPDTYVRVSFFTKHFRWLLLHIITPWLEHCSEIFIVHSLIQNRIKYLRQSALRKYLKRISIGYSGDACSLQTVKSGDCWCKMGNACVHVYSV